MERRVLLAIFLAFLVLYVWQAVFVKPAPKPSGSSAGNVAATLVADNAERDVRVETRDVIAVFTNRGARLKSWRLKRYLDQQRQPQELIENTLQPLPFTLGSGEERLDLTLN